MQFDPRRDVSTVFHFILANSGISVRLAQPTIGVRASGARQMP